MLRIAPLLLLTACADLISVVAFPCSEQCETAKECVARGEHIERCEMRAQECRVCMRDGGQVDEIPSNVGPR